MPPAQPFELQVAEFHSNNKCWGPGESLQGSKVFLRYVGQGLTITLEKHGSLLSCNMASHFFLKLHHAGPSVDFARVILSPAAYRFEAWTRMFKDTHPTAGVDGVRLLIRVDLTLAHVIKSWASFLQLMKSWVPEARYIKGKADLLAEVEDPNEILVETPRTAVSRSAIARIHNDEAWVNDMIIDIGIDALLDQYPDSAKRVVALRAGNWRDLDPGPGKAPRHILTRKLDPFGADFLVVPVHRGKSHWTLCIVWNTKLCLRLPKGSKTPNPSNDINDRCVVFHMDSMGSEAAHEFRVIREYLGVHAGDRLGGGPVEVSQKIIPAGYIVNRVVSVPQQRNFTDCGLFMLHFCEVFMKNPDDILGVELNNKQNPFWREGRLEGATLRSQYRSLVDRMAAAWHQSRML